MNNQKFNVLRFVFDTFLVMLAIVFTFSFTFITGLFVDAYTEMWVFFLYLYAFMMGIYGVKTLGRYYVRNFL